MNPRRLLRIGIAVFLVAVSVVFVLNMHVFEWDNTGHRYHLVRTLRSLFSTGFPQFMDSATLFNYPANFFYGPASYLITAPLYLLIPDISILYNVFILFAFLLVFLGIRAVNATLPVPVSAVSLLAAFCLCLLIDPPDHLFYGLGYGGILKLGVVPFFYGIGFSLLGFAAMRRFLDTPSLRSGAGVVLFSSLTLLSSVLAAFFLLALSFSLIFRREFLARMRYLALLVVLILLATLFFTVPFLANYDRTNAFGLHGLYHSGDPVLVLLSTFFGIVFLVTVIAGTGVSFKMGMLSYPLLVLALFAVLPRNLLSSTLSLDLHYYRFLAPILLVAVPLAGRAFDRFFPGKTRFVVLALILSVLTISLGSYASSSTSAYRKLAAFRKDLRRLLRNTRVRGRLYYESDRSQMARFGTPYAFLDASMPPGITWLNGLFAESSPVTGYGLSALDGLAASFFGGKKILGRRHFSVANTPDERFAFVHGEYGLNGVFAASSRFTSFLDKKIGRSAVTNRIGNIKFYRTGSFGSSRILTNQVALFHDPDGRYWREFLPGWISNKYLRKVRLVRADRSTLLSLLGMKNGPAFVITSGYRNTLMMYRLFKRRKEKPLIIGLNVPFFLKTKDVLALKQFSRGIYDYIRLHFLLHKNRARWEKRQTQYVLHFRNFFPWLAGYSGKQPVPIYESAPHNILSFGPVSRFILERPAWYPVLYVVGLMILLSAATAILYPRMQAVLVKLKKRKRS